ncbi:MAG: hypothetical protein ACOYKC_01195 [Anaerolineaceae bacterium]|jgi:hypothetical protein
MDKHKKPADDKALFALFAIVHSNRSAEPTPLELWDLMNTLAQEGTEECAKLIAWRDALLFHCCDNLAAHYIDQVGRYENKYQQSLLRLKKMERRLELVRQQIDLAEPVFLSQLEKQLDQEFNDQHSFLLRREELTKSLDEELLEGNVGRNIYDEIIEPYTAVIRSLHPDLNPDQEPEQFLAFNKAQNAFENGDVETIEQILSNYPPPDILPYLWDPQQVMQRIDQLLELNDDLDNELDKIMKEFPYDKFDLLENEEAVEQLVCNLQEKEQAIQTEIAHKEEELQQLLQNNPWVI